VSAGGWFDLHLFILHACGFSVVRELYFLCTRTTMHGISGIVGADAVMPALAFFSFPLGYHICTEAYNRAREIYHNAITAAERTTNERTKDH
jgi:hypothetical protein